MASLLQLEKQESFALYIHIPFCVTKCPYCDFNSYGLGQEFDPQKPLEDEKSYVAALCLEMEHYSQKSAWANSSISSIFFGGGTPSILQESSIEKIIKKAYSLWPSTDKVEITLECNPGTLRESLGAEKLAGFYRAGVNRLSFGAQSLRQKKLKSLGRLHNTKDIYHSLESAKAAGFNRINLDFMYGLPEESESDWQSELEEITAIAPSHLSIYCLTIEPGTEFWSRQRRGYRQQAPDEVLAKMYSACQETLAKKGFVQYEISNFAKPGHECLHNLSYWRWESYLGIGAGAHSFVRRDKDSKENTSFRWSNIPKPSHYVNRVNTEQAAKQRIEKLNCEQEQLEVIYCFLRTNLGIPVKEFSEFFGKSPLEYFQSPLNLLLAQGLVVYDEEKIQLTSRGYLFSDHVLSELAASN